MLDSCPRGDLGAGLAGDGRGRIGPIREPDSRGSAPVREVRVGQRQSEDKAPPREDGVGARGSLPGVCLGLGGRSAPGPG